MPASSPSATVASSSSARADVELAIDETINTNNPIARRFTSVPQVLSDGLLQRKNGVPVVEEILHVFLGYGRVLSLRVE